MNKLKNLNSLDQINLLSDPRRLAILQLLMVKPMTVSQLGRQLDEYPAGIRYHIKKLEQAELVELSEVKVSSGYTEKYYSSKSQVFRIQRIFLPSSGKKLIIFMGSHDLAFEQLSAGFEQENQGVRIFNLPVGSLDGLIALRQGIAHISGCHLFDPESKQFNSPYIKHIFPDQSMKMITLGRRVQGLIFSAGNPKQISSLNDLERKDIKFINRNQGSGTRIWLDNQLTKLVLPSNDINGYTREVNSHTGIAHEIKIGTADVGLGLIAAAVEADLDFIPLFEEQYDLVIPSDRFDHPIILDILDYLTTSDFRQSFTALEGYTSERTGTCVVV
jgi:molybdate-binding protein